MNILLGSAYFPPVQWFWHLNRADRSWVEHCDSFQKQTYRNRCVIATTAGTQTLTVPVEHGESRLGRDTRVSNHGNWQHLHWQALQSAYGESPFFDFLADDLHPFFLRDYKYLYDLNMDIIQTLCELIDIHPTISLTTEYMKPECQQDSAPHHQPGCPAILSPGSAPLLDLRLSIHPKHPAPDPLFRPTPYYQVYSHKHGFQANLSILDLLLNMGRETVMYL
ncbi:MAG: WbqC family protein [Prevotella sp.]|jgi:hypothetical protein|nr:WbqC family protein [Prevotella sp.]